MYEPAKRQRTQVQRVDISAPSKKTAPPPTIHLGRVCRFRLPQSDGSWISGTLRGYKGVDKQQCEVELEDGKLRRLHLASQPIHVAHEVRFGPPKEHEETALRGAASRKPGCLAEYMKELVPVLIFTPLGPPELEAEDGHALALDLETEEYLWLLRESTRPMAAHMLSRRTPPAKKAGYDAALAHHTALHRLEHLALQKKALGRRLCVFWPMDDAWCARRPPPPPSPHRPLPALRQPSAAPRGARAFHGLPPLLRRRARTTAQPRQARRHRSR